MRRSISTTALSFGSTESKSCVPTDLRVRPSTPSPARITNLGSTSSLKSYQRHSFTCGRAKTLWRVQAFNVSQTSGDFKFDLELFDPFGPDLSAPSIVDLNPAAGRLLAELNQIEVTFSEEVTGITADDLIVAGSPARTLTGEGAGPYLFRVPSGPRRGSAIELGPGATASPTSPSAETPLRAASGRTPSIRRCLPMIWC